MSAERPVVEPLVEPVADLDAPTAVAVLRAAEAQAGGELVDEAERRRLDALASDPPRHAARWQPYVAHLEDEAVGYAGLVLPEDPGGTAVGDAAPSASPQRAKVLQALLGALTAAATEAGAGQLEVWARQVSDTDVAAAADAGLSPRRRLAVLQRALPVTGPVPQPPSGVTIRAYRPDEDDAEVVRVLQGAYAGTADAGWDLDAFRTRRGWDWFRAEDLLVAADDAGPLLGLHWLKRRDEVTGEVHNLAVHPDGRGRGLGPVLLRAGLDHLAAIGCGQVLLWVDRANERAVRLYEAAGFTTRTDDVAFGRDLSAAR